MAAIVNTPPDPLQFDPAWKPPAGEQWSIPKVITDEVSGIDDNAIRLRQGIICEIKMDAEWLFQNVNMNEDDVIDFSFHGNPDGIWGQLNTHSFVRAKTNLFLLNRTHKDVLYLATFKQNDN